MGWYAFFDQNGDMAEKTRRRVYDMVAAEKLQVRGFHYPFPRTRQCGKGRQRLPGGAHAVESDDLILVVIPGRARSERTSGAQLRTGE